MVVMDKAVTPRSYMVKTEEGRLLWRNRKHLMKLHEQSPEPEPDIPIPYNLPGERYAEQPDGERG